MRDGRRRHDRRKTSSGGARPPAAARWLLSLLAGGEKQTLMGDLEEYYYAVLEDRGAGRAARAYTAQALSAVLHLSMRSLAWRLTMLRSYAALAMRNIRREKVYSIINIAGLATGLTCSFLIAMWVVDEVSYDRQEPGADRIYRAYFLRGEQGTRIAWTPALLAEAFERDIAQIEQAAFVYHVRRKMSIRVGDRYFLDDGPIISDGQFFDVFDVDFLRGSAKTALSRPNSVVLSRTAAQRYFGGEDPIGRTIGISTIEGDYEVTGVFRDRPRRSHLQYDMIFTYDWRTLSWGSNSGSTYLKLAGGASPEDLAPLMRSFIDKNYGPYVRESFGMSMDELMSDPEKRFEMAFQPLTSIHLDRAIRDDLQGKGDIVHVYTFSIVALLILLVACVNFVNLSTARAGKRAKEVGVRKVAGADRAMLIRQFLVESVLSGLLAFVLAAGLVYLLLPHFNTLTGKEIQAADIFSPAAVAALLGASFVSGLLAGAYPAFYLSAFEPAEAVKSGGRRAGSRALSRDALVVFQYTVATVIFLSAFVIYSQSRFLTSARLGFDKDRVLVVHRARVLGDRLGAFMEELGRIPGVETVCNTSTLPGRHFDDTGHRLEGAPDSEEIMLYTIASDSRLVDLLGLEVTRGRFFSEEIETDRNSAVVINETAARVLGLDDPVGKRFRKEFDGAGEGEFVTIVGVLKDFNFSSLHNRIAPMIVRNLGSRPGYYVSLRFTGGDPAGVVKSVKDAWKSFSDEGIFEYSFLDDDFDSLYRSEMRTGRIMSTFFVLAVFIACLGLYGLASYTAEQRTKEIGIRKVLGASTGDILVLLSRRMTALVILANVVAWPVSYLLMRRWLDNFAYRIDLTPWMPLASLLVGLALALLTIGHRALSAARTAPATNIRYE